MASNLVDPRDVEERLRSACKFVQGERWEEWLSTLEAGGLEAAPWAIAAESLEETLTVALTTVVHLHREVRSAWYGAKWQIDSGRCDTRLPFRRFLRLAASCVGQSRESWRGPKIVEVNWRRPGRWWRRQLPTAIRRVGFRSLSTDDQMIEESNGSSQKQEQPACTAF